MPYQVMLDNSAVNYFYNEGVDWQKTKLGKLLIEYTENNIIEVYAIPDNVIEIALCPDLRKRQIMALALDTLIDGKRMHYSWESDFTLNFLLKIKMHWPAAIKDESRFKLSSIRFVYGYLSLLAHLALHEKYYIDSYEAIIRPKIETTYIQSCFVKEGDKLLDLYIELLNKPVTDNEFQKHLDEIKNKPLAEIRNLILSNLTQPFIKPNISKLQKHKSKLVERYTIKTALDALSVVIESICDFYITIDFDVIERDWHVKMPEFETDDVKPVESYALSTREKSNIYYFLLAILKRYYHLGALVLPQVMMEIYFSELMRTMRSPDTISQGLALDINYATALFNADIFVTFDDKLTSSLKTYSKNLNRPTECKILNGTDELAKFLIKDSE